MPITFVFDCKIDDYTIATWIGKPTNCDQHTSAPITFINDSMINSAKTEEQRNDRYHKTKEAKRADLTSVLSTPPERHPTKKLIKSPSLTVQLAQAAETEMTFEQALHDSTTKK